MKEKLLKTYGWQPADGDYNTANELRKQNNKKNKSGNKATKAIKKFIDKKLSTHILKSLFN